RYRLRLLAQRCCSWPFSSVFFFTDTATTEIYTLSLHDALPISERAIKYGLKASVWVYACVRKIATAAASVPWIVERRVDYGVWRSEEHTSELQSRENLVCRLLLEKKKKRKKEDERTHLT